MPRSEKKCEKELIKKDIQVFLPKCTTVNQWSDRKKKVETPLFQNYIFARVDERDRIRVLQTKGIVRCISFGGKLATVTAQEIEQLKIVQAHPEWIEALAHPIPSLGASVQIQEGPLQGLKGEVIEHRGLVSLVVRIPSIKQSIKVVLPNAIVGQC